MFVTCHITFGQPSNFIGATLEVTRTIWNNKLPFTWGCSILLLKKGKGPWDRIPFFFQWFWHFLKYFNSNHNLPSYSLFSKCFWWFFFILVCIGVEVCFRSCIFNPYSRAWLALVLALRLPPFHRKTLKTYACSADPGLLNETNGSWFPLSCLHIKTNGQGKLFLITTSTFR